MANNQTLEVNQIAPDFALQAHTGKIVSLAEYAGKTNVILFFVRTYSCYSCRQHVEYLARTYSELQKRDTEVLAIINTDPASAEAYADVTRAPFPVLADPDHKTYEAYGLDKLFVFATRTASVLIDKQGAIRYLKSLGNPWAWRNETETLLVHLEEMKLAPPMSA